MAPDPQIAGQQTSASRVPLVVLTLIAIISTTTAVVLAATGRAPGDQPLPLLWLGAALAAFASLCRLAPPIHVGLAAMSGFPIGAAIDLILHGGHNLLPIEFAFYGIYLGIGVVLAVAGNRIALLLAR